MSDPTTTPTPTETRQDTRMVIDYETVWDAVEASINLNADEKVEVQTLLRMHAYPLAAVSAAAPELPENPCAACGKPRREHRSGYSAYRCTFRAVAAPDERAEVEQERDDRRAWMRAALDLQAKMRQERARADAAEAALTARPAPTCVVIGKCAIHETPEPDCRVCEIARPAPTVSDLLPAESIALTVALAQVQRGDDPSPNVAGMCVLALARLAGRHDWTVADAPTADDEGGQER